MPTSALTYRFSGRTTHQTVIGNSSAKVTLLPVVITSRLVVWSHIVVTGTSSLPTPALQAGDKPHCWSLASFQAAARSRSLRGVTDQIQVSDFVCGQDNAYSLSCLVQLYRHALQPLNEVGAY